MQYASHINKKGQCSIAAQMKALDCNWDLNALLTHLENTNTFLDAQKGQGISIESSLKHKTGQNHFWQLEADEIEFTE